jgi:hypothetical protein
MGGRRSGVHPVLEQEKPKARKMLKNNDQFPPPYVLLNKPPRYIPA